MSEDFLATMAAASLRRVELARAQVSTEDLFERALRSPAPQRLVLSPERFDLIAEVKLRSPAAGALRGAQENVTARVVDYAAAGAAAVSVLTEPSRFDGSLEHLQLASAALAPRGVPAMRKDFIVDPYQLAEARLAGAGGVLIILRMLHDTEAHALLEAASLLKLFVLMETFDLADIETAHRIAISPVAHEVDLLVGLNSRDLATLKVVPGRLEELVHELPEDLPRVAESGLTNGADAGRLAAAGYDLALVGSALMTSDDPTRLLGEMLSEGRKAR